MLTNLKSSLLWWLPLPTCVTEQVSACVTRAYPMSELDSSHLCVQNKFQFLVKSSSQKMNLHSGLRKCLLIGHNEHHWVKQEPMKMWSPPLGAHVDSSNTCGQYLRVCFFTMVFTPSTHLSQGSQRNTTVILPLPETWKHRNTRGLNKV